MTCFRQLTWKEAFTDLEKKKQVFQESNVMQFSQILELFAKKESFTFQINMDHKHKKIFWIYF